MKLEQLKIIEEEKPPVWLVKLIEKIKEEGVDLT